MSNQPWKDLMKKLQIITRGGEVTPVDQKELTQFEEKRGIQLPHSYREYCMVFGPGELGTQFRIAVPGFKGVAQLYALEDIDRVAHEGLEYKVYSKNPEQHERGIFFCLDIARSYHFFDPEEVSDSANHEYAVYTLFSDFEIQRTADSYWQFVTEFCLGDKHDQLIRDIPVKKVFMPVTR